MASQNLNNSMNGDCPICAQKMVFPTEIPNCKHAFCFPCLKGVAIVPGAQCPMCRGAIDPSVIDNPVQKYDLLMCDPNSPATSSKATKKVVKRKLSSNGNSNGTTDGGDNGTSGKKVKVEVDEEEEEEDVKPDINQLNNAAPPVKPHYWIYQGINGWWRFDPRMEKELEEALSNNKFRFETVIVGSTYVIDLHSWQQYPKTDTNKTRHIRRVDEDEFKRLPIKGIAGVLLDRH
ncbi:hypothetical protein WR25_02205 [Diploscapter pachys]|uniref:E3 ubiquitin-protein ligase n=1 Tax=Diploscapter pachys TaxID=2018661 RepID=A0A2A2J9E0_9BILA|nr:hypothetical protein WR25_02205 [Diploscapter pachys]